VKGFMHFAQMLVGDVRVHLRRRDVRVAEERLHASQISAVLEKVRRE